MNLGLNMSPLPSVAAVGMDSSSRHGALRSRVPKNGDFLRSLTRVLVMRSLKEVGMAVLLIEYSVARVGK